MKLSTNIRIITGKPPFYTTNVIKQQPPPISNHPFRAPKFPSQRPVFGIHGLVGFYAISNSSCAHPMPPSLGWQIPEGGDT